MNNVVKVFKNLGCKAAEEFFRTRPNSLATAVDLVIFEEVSREILTAAIKHCKKEIKELKENSKHEEVVEQ